MINFTAFCENEHKLAFFLSFLLWSLFVPFENITPILRITILLIWYICYFEVTSKLLMIARKIHILRSKYLNWYFIISKNNLHCQKNSIVILLTIVQVRMQNENRNKHLFGLDFTVSQINNFSFIEDIIILQSCQILGTHYKIWLV